MSRTIRTREGSWLHRALTVTLAETPDRGRAESSPLCWAPHTVRLAVITGEWDDLPTLVTVYRLTPLGILHALTGLTLDVTL